MVGLALRGVSQSDPRGGSSLRIPPARSETTRQNTDGSRTAGVRHTRGGGRTLPDMAGRCRLPWGILSRIRLRMRTCWCAWWHVLGIISPAGSTTLGMRTPWVAVAVAWKRQRPRPKRILSQDPLFLFAGFLRGQSSRSFLAEGGLTHEFRPCCSVGAGRASGALAFERVTFAKTSSSHHIAQLSFNMTSW